MEVGEDNLGRGTPGQGGRGKMTILVAGRVLAEKLKYWWRKMDGHKRKELVLEHCMSETLNLVIL